MFQSVRSARKHHFPRTKLFDGDMYMKNSDNFMVKTGQRCKHQISQPISQDANAQNKHIQPEPQMNFYDQILDYPLQYFNIKEAEEAPVPISELRLTFDFEAIQKQTNQSKFQGLRRFKSARPTVTPELIDEDNYLLELYKKSVKSRPQSNIARVTIPGQQSEKSRRYVLENLMWNNIINPPLKPQSRNGMQLVKEIDERLTRQSLEFCKLEKQLYDLDLKQSAIEAIYMKRDKVLQK